MLSAATVHFPYMTAWPDRASDDDRAATQAGFARLGKAFADAGIDTLITVTSEHIVNLQPRMAPAFVVGVGERHAAFPEPQFNLEPVTRAGDPALAQELVQALYEQGLDPAHSCELRLDHGATLPLALLKLPAQVAIVPIVINCFFPPLPPLKRCRALGTAIAAAMQRSKLQRKIGLLATGGISHTVGAPGMDRNDPELDAGFVQALLDADLDRATGYSDERLDAAGNGTHEIRTWIVAAAAAHPQRPKAVTAIPYARGWDTGVHQLLWEAP
ncbi:MAG: hypothetical protein AB7L76_15575 [Burkholderiaceae bacterium]